MRTRVTLLEAVRTIGIWVETIGFNDPCWSVGNSKDPDRELAKEPDKESSRRNENSVKMATGSLSENDVSYWYISRDTPPGCCYTPDVGEHRLKFVRNWIQSKLRAIWSLNQQYAIMMFW